MAPTNDAEHPAQPKPPAQKALMHLPLTSTNAASQPSQAKLYHSRQCSSRHCVFKWGM